MSVIPVRQSALFYLISILTVFSFRIGDANARCDDVQVKLHAMHCLNQMQNSCWNHKIIYGALHNRGNDAKWGLMECQRVTGGANAGRARSDIDQCSHSQIETSVKGVIGENVNAGWFNGRGVSNPDNGCLAGPTLGGAASPQQCNDVEIKLHTVHCLNQTQNPCWSHKIIYGALHNRGNDAKWGLMECQRHTGGGNADRAREDIAKCNPNQITTSVKGVIGDDPKAEWFMGRGEVSSDNICLPGPTIGGKGYRCSHPRNVCKSVLYCLKSDKVHPEDKARIKNISGNSVYEGTKACQTDRGNLKDWERDSEGCLTPHFNAIVNHLIPEPGSLKTCDPYLTNTQLPIVKSIVEDADQRWMDKNGWIRQTPNPSPPQRSKSDHQNPVLFMAEYFYLLKKIGVMTGETRAKYKSWALSAIDQLRLKPGLFDRFPEDRTRNRNPPCDGDEVLPFSRDEQIGLLIMDWIFDGELAVSRELFEYGRQNTISPAIVTHAMGVLSPSISSYLSAAILAGNVKLWDYENRTWRLNGRKADQLCRNGDQKNWPESRILNLRTPKFQNLVRAALNLKPREVGIHETIWALDKTAEDSGEGGKILGLLRAEILIGNLNNSGRIQDAVAEFEAKLYDQYGDNPLGTMLTKYHEVKSPADFPIISLSKFAAPSYARKDVIVKEFQKISQAALIAAIAAAAPISVAAQAPSPEKACEGKGRVDFHLKKAGAEGIEILSATNRNRNAPGLNSGIYRICITSNVNSAPKIYSFSPSGDRKSHPMQLKVHRCVDVFGAESINLRIESDGPAESKGFYCIAN